MKNPTIFCLALCFLSILFTGCTETINNIQLDTTRPRLVVEGYLSTDTTRQMVRLSKLCDALKQDPIQAISKAAITISDGIKTFGLTEDENKKGTYYTAPDVYGVPGRTYSLSIKNVDINNDGVKEEYTAQSQLKIVNPIDSVHLVYSDSNPHFVNWSVNLYTMDPGHGRNFYLIKVIKNSILLTDSVFKYSIGDNSGFEGKYFNGFPVYTLREERKDEKLVRGDTLVVELFGITEDYYSFIYSYINDYYPKIPIFSGPSANIPSNIKPVDDAVGIFAAYSVKRKMVIYK